MAPSPLASAARRFFAPRASPASHPDAADIKAHVPDLAASVLREANCSLPRSLKTIVNNRGSVTLIVVDTSVTAASYAPYFEALTTKLNQSFPIRTNPWLPFRLAPTSVQLAIHSLPVDYMPLQDENLFSYLSDSILNSKNVTISAARFLNPNRQSCMEKRAYSVVVNVEPDSVQTILPSIYLFGNSRTVEKAYSSSPLTHCQKCWKYGHVKPLCKAESPICPLCSLQHTKAEHCCPNPSCPSGGNLKAILGCCLASPARCSNCWEAHSPRSRDCPERPPPPALPAAPAIQENQAVLDPDQIDVHPDAQPADPSRPAAPRSNTPPQGLLPPFQEETPRAPRTTIVAPPAMTRSASKGGLPPPRGRLAPHLPLAIQQAQAGKMSYTCESLPPGLGPGHTLSIVQHNCLGS